MWILAFGVDFDAPEIFTLLMAENDVSTTLCDPRSFGGCYCSGIS